MREVKIEIPEGYEIDKDNSTFERIIFKELKKVLTYDDVARELFIDKTFYTDGRGRVDYQSSSKNTYSDPNNATSKEQLESILALNKLCNVAKYLNGDWVSTFHRISSFKYKFIIDCDGKLFIDNSNGCIGSAVYFKSKELAEQALKILGEEEIKKALILNY